MKPIKVGNATIQPVEMDASITKIVDLLNMLHDSGELKSVLVAYTTEHAAGGACAGDFIHRPALSLLASGLATQVLDSIYNAVFGAQAEGEEADDGEGE